MGRHQLCMRSFQFVLVRATFGQAATIAGITTLMSGFRDAMWSPPSLRGLGAGVLDTAPWRLRVGAGLLEIREQWPVVSHALFRKTDCHQRARADKQQWRVTSH